MREVGVEIVKKLTPPKVIFCDIILNLVSPLSIFNLHIHDDDAPPPIYSMQFEVPARRIFEIDVLDTFTSFLSLFHHQRRRTEVILEEVGNYR